MSINPFGDAAEQLVAHFYAWEQRGRGWQGYPHPVELEPPFRCFEHYVRVPVDVDDGRRPGLLLSVLTLGRAGSGRAAAPTEGEEDPEPTPRPYVPGSIGELHVLLPEDFDPGRGATESLLHVARACSHPVSFE